MRPYGVDTPLGYLAQVLNVIVSGDGHRGSLSASRGYTMTTAIYAVAGLTCADCMAKVLEHVHSVSGVTHVAMDLVAGGQSPLLVRSGTKLGADAVRDAVVIAGFDLLAPRGRRVHRSAYDAAPPGSKTDPYREPQADSRLQGIFTEPLALS